MNIVIISEVKLRRGYNPVAFPALFLYNAAVLLPSRWRLVLISALKAPFLQAGERNSVSSEDPLSVTAENHQEMILLVSVAAILWILWENCTCKQDLSNYEIISLRIWFHPDRPNSG